VNCDSPDALFWRKGSLFGGPLDVQRVLHNLHKTALGG
jgi:hypothetical protein